MNGETPCRLCPRRCGVLRDPDTGKGFCRVGSTALVARAAPHIWEEPCISGTRGTGAVFFSGCTLRCAYCQNCEISHDNKGRPLSPRQLADVFKRLEDSGVHSLSLITATHFLPAVLSAFELYRPKIPIVYNCGGYELVETVRRLDGLVDVWLPDIKNQSPKLSKLLLGCGDYFEHASAAVKQMCRQSGPAQYNAEGIMTRGTLVRHLIIPGCISDTINILRFVAEELPGGTPLSLMRQYTPSARCRISGLDRRITDAEYKRALAAFEAFGLEGFVQQAESADSAYTPPFDGSGLDCQT